MNLSFEANPKHRQYRGFNLYGDCEASSETTARPGHSMKPTSSVGFKHTNGVITELDPVSFSDDL